jgi:hypothetical protein
MARPNPLNPKAVTRKRMEEAGEEEADAPAPAPRKTTMSQATFSKAAPKDAAKDKAGLAAAIKKRGY